MTLQLNSLTAEIYDSSSIIFYFNGIYDTISLYKSLDGGKTYEDIETDISTNPYTSLNLLNNKFYTFKAEPYDIYGISGETLLTNIFLNYDLEITNFYYENITETSLILYWKGNYQAVNIQYKLSKYLDTAYTDNISIIDKNSHIIKDLDENTNYTFKITPKFLSGIISDTSYIITATTSFKPYISTFILEEIYDYKVKLSWSGYYSFIKFQYSLTENSGYKTLAVLNYNTDISGLYIFTNLLAYTTYYFRAIPYNNAFIQGEYSNIIKGSTLPGIKTFSKIISSQTTNTIYWSGTYKQLDLYKSIDNGITYNLLQHYSIPVEDISNITYIDTDLSVNTPYYYYLQPYVDSIYGISYELYTSTNYDSTIYFYVTSITTDSLTLYIDPSGSNFTKALIQLSKDNSSFYDIGYVYKNNIYYTISDLNDNITNDYTYYVKITPYGLFSISGTTTLTQDIQIEGNTRIIDLSVNVYTDMYFSGETFYTQLDVSYSIAYTFPNQYIKATDASHYIINSLEIETF